MKWGNRPIRYKFGQDVVPSVGIVQIKLPENEFSHLLLHIDIVDIETALLIVLEILKPQSLVINYIDNTL